LISGVAQETPAGVGTLPVTTPAWSPPEPFHGGFVQHLESHLPHKLLAHPDALLRQSVNDAFGGRVQADAVERISDRSFHTDRTHVAILQSDRPACSVTEHAIPYVA